MSHEQFACAIFAFQSILQPSHLLIFSLHVLEVHFGWFQMLFFVKMGTVWQKCLHFCSYLFLHDASVPSFVSTPMKTIHWFSWMFTVNDDNVLSTTSDMKSLWWAHPNLVFNSIAHWVKGCQAEQERALSFEVCLACNQEQATKKPDSFGSQAASTHAAWPACDLVVFPRQALGFLPAGSPNCDQHFASIGLAWGLGLSQIWTVESKIAIAELTGWAPAAWVSLFEKSVEGSATLQKGQSSTVSGRLIYRILKLFYLVRNCVLKLPRVGMRSIWVGVQDSFVYYHALGQRQALWWHIRWTIIISVLL